MKKKNKRIPFPEIVSGEDGWKVFEDAKRPRTSNQSKEMYVPFGDACDECGHMHDKQIRRHELAHVKWSPKTMGKLGPNESEICVSAIEEIRVHYLLANRNMGIEDWVVCPKDSQKTAVTLIHESSPFEILLYLISCSWIMGSQVNDLKGNKRSYYNYAPDGYEYEDFKDSFEALKNSGTLTKVRILEVQWAISQAIYFFKRIMLKRKDSWGVDTYYKPGYRKTRTVAKELHALMEEFDYEPEPEDVFEHLRKEKEARENQKTEMANMRSEAKDGEGEGEDGEGEGEGDDTLQAAKFRTKMQLAERFNNGKANPMDYSTSNKYDGRWEDMRIETGPLEINLNGLIKKGREYRPMDFGTNPKYINRYCIDKKIFKQRQRTYGGTILIDASGSMRFDGEDILEIMQELPAVTIAMYNQQYGNHGTLRIIGKDGKRVTEEYLDMHSGGGNGVDGPALEWLAKMPPARIWISDMYVFGRYGGNEINLLQECIQICKRNGITRLADINEVKKFALEINKLQ